MFAYLMFLVFIAALIVVDILMGIKVVRPNERIAVFYLGKFSKITGPGFVFIFKPIYQGVRIDLEKNIPSWRALSKKELDGKVKDLVLSKPITRQ